MATLNLCPVDVDLCFSRGDTVTFSFTIREGTPPTPIDITGSSFLLTVDPSPAPTGSGNNLFQLTGAIIGAATDGTFAFQPTAVQMNQTPSVYFYDVQWTDASSEIRTVISGQFEIQQDVTK